MTEEDLNKLLCDAYMLGITEGVKNPNILLDTVDPKSAVSLILQDYSTKESAKTQKLILVPREQIILYYFKKHPHKYIKVETLEDLLNYMWRKLHDQNKLQDYQISYTVFVAEVAKMCAMQSTMFYFDEFTGYIWGSDRIIKKKDCDLDATIKNIIDSFLKERK